MRMSLFFQLFAGVPMDEMDVFPLVPLGRWLFTIGMYLLVISFLSGRMKQNRQFVMIRYGWIQKWWKHHFLKNLLGGVLLAMVLLGVFQSIDLFIMQNRAGSMKETAMVVLLWTVHGITLSALFLFMDNQYGKKHTGCTAASGRGNIPKRLSVKRNFMFYVWLMGNVCAE